MTLQELKAIQAGVKAAQIIYMSDGQQFFVPHTGFLLIPPVGEMFIIVTPKSKWHFLSVNQVTSVIPEVRKDSNANA